jgi:tetratricopeptide (TPR) repeat protein
VRALVFAAVLPLLASPAACRRASPDLPPEARALLAVGAELGGEPPTDEAARALRALAPAGGAGKDPAAALNAAIFDAGGFSREVEDRDLRYVLLPSVLATRRGSCVGLGTLYLALAAVAGVEARGVLVPGHFYVQVRQGQRWRSVELLRRGEEMPESWYRQKYGAGGQPLSPSAVVGVVAYDVGNERRRQGRLAEARRAYERAARVLPTFARAHAGLGATLQLLGDLDGAAAAYARARALDSALPGLDRNVELLEAERARRD